MPLTSEETTFLNELLQPRYQLDNKNIDRMFRLRNNPEFVIAVMSNPIMKNLVLQHPEDMRLARFLLADIAMRDLKSYIKSVEESVLDISDPLFVALAKTHILTSQLDNQPLNYAQYLKTAWLTEEFDLIFEQATRSLAYEDKIALIFDKLSTPGGLIPRHLNQLQKMQIDAIKNKDKKTIAKIKEYLIKHDEINTAYRKYNIDTLRPKSPGADQIPPVSSEPRVRVTQKTVRYLHQDIKIKHLRPDNGKIFSNEAINNMIISMKDSKVQDHEYKPGSSLNIIKIQTDDNKDKFCVLYSKVGKGSFGTVTLAQDLTSDTGEWIVVKEIVLDPATNLQQQLDEISLEISALREANQYIGKMEIIDVNGHHHIYIAQTLAEGIELKKAIETEDSFLKYIRPYVWLNFGFNLLDAYKKQVADIGITGHVNRDLKLGNTIVNSVTGTIRIIDKGMSAPKNSQGNVVDSDIKGTPEYIAPEHSHPITQGVYIYNEKTEIFALGLMLLKFYQFPHQYDFLIEQYQRNGVELGAIDLTSPAMRRFPNDIIREELYTLLVKMVSLKPEDRPTLADCLKQLRAINDLTLLCTTITKNIAVFDINDYRLTTDPLQKIKMIDELKNADEVWLLDSAKLKNEFEYLFIVNELQKHNIRMGQRLFAQPSTNRVALQLSLIKDVKNVVTEQHPDDILRFTYVTSAIESKAFTEQLNKVGIKHVNINKPITEQVINNSRSKHIEALNKDIIRLSDKYQGKNTEINQVIKQIVNLKDDLRKNDNQDVEVELVERYITLQTLIEKIENKFNTSPEPHTPDIDTKNELNIPELLKNLESYEQDIAVVDEMLNRGNKALEEIVGDMKELRDDLINDQSNTHSTDYFDTEIATLQQQMYSDVAISFVMQNVHSDSLTETSILKNNDSTRQSQGNEHSTKPKSQTVEKDLKQQVPGNLTHSKQQSLSGKTPKSVKSLRLSQVTTTPTHSHESKQLTGHRPEQKQR